jgi:hypothetical protein
MQALGLLLVGPVCRLNVPFVTLVLGLLLMAPHRRINAIYVILVHGLRPSQLRHQVAV